MSSTNTQVAAGEQVDYSLGDKPAEYYQAVFNQVEESISVTIDLNLNG